MNDGPQPVERILFLSHADFVELKDRNPRLVSDDRVTVIPYPLVGRWVADEEIKALQAGPNTVLLRDSKSSRYVLAESALLTLALTQAHIFSEVCQLLGATSLKTVEYDTTASSSQVTNKLTANTEASVSPDLSGKKRFSADFAADLQQEVRRHIEASSTFDGGAPDIAAARARAAEFDDVTHALDHLIKLRESELNRIRHHQVQVDFLSTAHKQVDLLLEFVRGLRLALPKETHVNLEAKLTNQFQWSNDTNRKQRFSIEVHFERL